MHGHGLLTLAEEEHIDEWADFAGSAVYGAMKRLAAEELITEDRIEKQGNYPERQFYRISESGRVTLDALRSQALSEIVIKPDPFNLALARLDPKLLDELPARIEKRLKLLRTTFDHSNNHLAEIGHHLTVAESWAMRHQLSRWKSEIDWHQELLTELPSIIADEKSRKEPHA